MTDSEAWRRMTLAAVRRAVFLHGQETAALGLLLEQLRGIPLEEWADWAERFELALSEAGYERFTGAR